MKVVNQEEGQLLELRLREGDRVEAGQILASSSRRNKQPEEETRHSPATRMLRNNARMGQACVLTPLGASMGPQHPGCLSK